MTGAGYYRRFELSSDSGVQARRAKNIEPQKLQEKRCANPYCQLGPMFVAAGTVARYHRECRKNRRRSKSIIRR